MSELIEYKCPNCGGAIKWDTGSQKMRCPFCDTEFEAETLKAYDEDLKTEENLSESMSWAKSEGSEWTDGDADGIYTYICDSCGGAVVGDETLAATSCPFCGNPVIIKKQFTGSLRPDYVIPFSLDKKTAKEAFARHLKGKKLLPKVFSSENHIDEIKGIYVPFWLFDADVDAHVRYKATKIRMWKDSQYQYTETLHYAAVRAGDMSFEHIPCDGSERMPDDLMESLEPFDFTKAVDFSTAYLSGFFADKYDVTAEQSEERANRRVRGSAEDMLKETVKGYTSVTVDSSSVSFTGGKIHYALYPVWILNTTWRDKKYQFAMNGQSGKFVGNLPMDKGKFAAWLLGLAGGISAAGIILSCIMF